MVAFGTVQKKQFRLVETGEYVFTLNDLGEITGDFGDRMQWDFLVADKATPTEYISVSDDGKERVLRFFTDPEITIGSRQHEWIQALAQTTLDVGDEPPDGSELLGKRMVGYLTHYTPKKGKNAGVPREDLVAGSVKPFILGKTKTNGALPKASKPAADDADERVDLIAQIKKQIRRAALADVDSGTVETWAALNLSELSTTDLRDGLQSIQDAITAAQEA